jgi:hypothetical protein
MHAGQRELDRHILVSLRSRDKAHPAAHVDDRGRLQVGTFSESIRHERLGDLGRISRTFASSTHTTATP